MDSETLEKQKLLISGNQESKHEKEREESDDKFAFIKLKARIEELETEFLIRNLNYKELREEFNNFKMLILKSEHDQLSKNIRDSFSIDKSKFLPNLENFGEVSESIYDYYKDKHILFTHDDNDLMLFSSRKSQNKETRFIDDDCDYDLENKYDDTVEKDFINKGVSGPSSSSDQQIISNNSNNKCDYSNNYKTSPLNPYAASFFPGKDYTNQEETTQGTQRNNDDQKDSNFLLNIPLYASNNIPYFIFLCNDFWRNHTNVVEKIHALVQQILYQFRLINRKVNVVSFRYLYFFEVDDLMNYEKSKEFNSLQKVHKKIIRNMINALLKDELYINITFVRNLNEYRSRGLIPKLPKSFKSYDDYTKSEKFQSLTKKKKKIIRRLAEKERNDE
ncbi:uncharacterized protein OCT59_015374 [Rhizophagus irregularis]|uniref:Uncharacterized protein n=5 Tax=Rhizophagus irregularis TaxID=588596 RepID=A0A915YZ96_9GLOM|nr:hypothetical protein GLOIN_2v1762403 [Rhizophagus irregularis DAOM 181602=DAOM 197198]EXX75832.1 hypothetical protein RirG_038450 [Rhizophagus irregularis DAOM 197198w]UZO23028.1 hypothetical protein OCT59_015374 [Rhizophagus irregularis]POG82209.1 hypothetical protein GLOIN_2v1762403 [Rhizophagus irregularis DAOM 181602=DAOM 197198]CAB4386528.1 unnamed protein product [Rhizophagus irregularis]CAB4463332.1 unnamed protein product [Rhizophagus irregularis]|eukprot:XP_025189075.1 hypothetical protein GLOIN_2v1762403 [Rhizophagus irregularis DAOM 181602=DAOM 197198]